MRILWQIAYFGFLAAFLGVPLFSGLVALSRVRAGRRSKGMAFLIFAMTALAPTALYVASFFALVGIEELTGAAIIAEEIGRSFLIVVGLGLVVWLLSLILFSIFLARTRPPGRVPTRT